MSSNMVLELVKLDFLIIAIPASRFALVWNSLGFFFSFLHIHIKDRTWEISHTRGCWRLSCRGPNSSRTIWEGRRSGEYWCRTLFSQSETSKFALQVIRAWLRVSGTPDGQRVQLGLATFLMPILCSLWWVGRMLWSILQRKVFCSEDKPFKLASAQEYSQSTVGLDSSALQGLLTLVLLSSKFMVMLFSKRTLYQAPEDMVDILSRPSSLTVLMFAKSSSDKYGFLRGCGMSLLSSTCHWNRARW